MPELMFLKDMTPGAYGIWLLVVMAAITAIKGWPKLKELQLGADGSLRADLLARIAAVEAEAKSERENARRITQECDARIDRLVTRHDEAIDELKAEIRVMRHDRNNVRAGFNALLAMIKRIDNPDLSGIAEAVEDMVARGDQPIAIEKAALSGLKGKQA